MRASICAYLDHFSFGEFGAFIRDAVSFALPAFANHIFRVVGGRTKKKVPGINASRVIAGVQDV